MRLGIVLVAMRYPRPLTDQLFQLNIEVQRFLSKHGLNFFQVDE
jgi:hypothetical protein